MDRFIKVLTIIKLLIQIAIFGLILGGMVYVLLNNPIPKLISSIQEQALKTFMEGGAGR